VLCDVFKPGDVVDVTAKGKGRGFQGVVRRHHFRGGAKSHGSMFNRAPGSIGASAFPSRVMKGMRMAGQMGDRRVTVRNLVVMSVDPENHLVAVRGAVPGARGGLVLLRRGLAPKKKEA
jgi:large subunit ribosomal protein L3